MVMRYYIDICVNRSTIRFFYTQVYMHRQPMKTLHSIMLKSIDRDSDIYPPASLQCVEVVS